MEEQRKRMEKNERNGRMERGRMGRYKRGEELRNRKG